MINPLPVVPPIGSVTIFVGNIIDYNSSPPASGIDPEALGWLVCDGRSLAIDKYPELYGALGNLYGGDDNSFNLPNLQGMFLRGIGTDTASTEERTKATNGEVNGVGSTQAFAMQTHIHPYTAPDDPLPITEGTATATKAVETTNQNAATLPPAQSATEKPGNVNISQYETRPTNMFVYYLIKYTSNLPYFNPHYS